MNKQFVRKMVQAKRLEYQALKEVMPEGMVKRVAKLENELMDFGKELIMTLINDTRAEDKEEDTAPETKVHKVTIE